VDWSPKWTHTYDRGLTQLLHSELRWLDIARRMQYKLGVMVHRRVSVNRTALQYLIDCCLHAMQCLRSPVDNASVRSSSCYQLLVPRHTWSTFGPGAFSVAVVCHSETRSLTISLHTVSINRCKHFCLMSTRVCRALVAESLAYALEITIHLHFIFTCGTLRIALRLSICLSVSLHYPDL